MKVGTEEHVELGDGRGAFEGIHAQPRRSPRHEPAFLVECDGAIVRGVDDSLYLYCRRIAPETFIFCISACPLFDRHSHGPGDGGPNEGPAEAEATCRRLRSRTLME